MRRLLVAIIQRLAGLSMGALEVLLLKFYQWVVDTAPPESWSVRMFTYLSTGPFKCASPSSCPVFAYCATKISRASSKAEC